MERTEEIVREERFFLRLCSKPYKEMVLAKRKMSFNDYNRISYALEILELFEYYIYFSFRYDASFKKEEMEELQITEYHLKYSAEDNCYAQADKYNVWAREFWEQIPSERQKRRYQELFWEELT